MWWTSSSCLSNQISKKGDKVKDPIEKFQDRIKRTAFRICVTIVLIFTAMTVYLAFHHFT